MGDRNFRERGNSQQQRKSVTRDKRASTMQPLITPQTTAGSPQITLEGPAAIGGYSLATMVVDCWYVTPFGRVEASSGP